jgi:hypothetical protein
VVRGRQGSCSCVSQTSSGSSARTPQLALGARLVELAEANGHVAADDDRPPSRHDDDHLQAARVSRRRDELKPGQNSSSPSTGA